MKQFLAVIVFTLAFPTAYSQTNLGQYFDANTSQVGNSNLEYARLAEERRQYNAYISAERQRDKRMRAAMEQERQRQQRLKEEEARNQQQEIREQADIEQQNRQENLKEAEITRRKLDVRMLSYLLSTDLHNADSVLWSLGMRIEDNAPNAPKESTTWAYYPYSPNEVEYLLIKTPGKTFNSIIISQPDESYTKFLINDLKSSDFKYESIDPVGIGQFSYVKWFPDGKHVRMSFNIPTPNEIRYHSLTITGDILKRKS